MTLEMRLVCAFVMQCAAGRRGCAGRWPAHRRQRHRVRSGGGATGAVRPPSGWRGRPLRRVALDRAAAARRPQMRGKLVLNCCFT